MSEIVRYRIPRQVKDSKQGGALIPFEPWSNATHNAKLQVKLDKWINEDQSRSGLVLAGFDRDDPDGPFALLSKPQDVDVVKTLSGDRKVVALSASQRVASSAAARKVAAYYEDQFGGNWRMTEFRPYEGEAVFEPLDGKVATARGLLASNGFKCEPWDIYVSKRRGGGFHVRLQGGLTYSEKYRAGIEEAIRQIAGREGWYYEADPKTGELDVIPAEPKTFPALVPFPFETLERPDIQKTPIGVKLARPGETPEVLAVNWKESLGVSLLGLSGGGKTVTINDILTQQAVAGAEVYVIDYPAKSVDFEFAKPFLARFGWGCESLLQAAGLTQYLLDEIQEGGKRYKAFKEHGWQNMDAIPEGERPKWPYIFLCVDELSRLTTGAKNGRVSKNTPAPAIAEAIEAQTKQYILNNLVSIAAVGRAFGYHMLVATQMGSATTGMPPALRGNLGNKLLMGPRPSDSQKATAFNNGRGVPSVPDNVIEEGVSKGTGSSEFEGQESAVFKSFFPKVEGCTDTEALGLALAEKLGLPEGVTLEEYRESFDQSKPINKEYQRKVMSRIDFPKAEAYRRLPYLRMLQDQYEEAMAELAGDTGAVPEGHDDVPKAPPTVNGQPLDSPLIDASLLAKRMEAER